MTARTAAYGAAVPERAALGRNAVRGALALGVIGLAMVLLGILMDPQQAYMSYLVAYTAVLGTVLGALILVVMSYVVGARWYVVLRRLTEAVAGTLPVLALLFVPILVGLRHIYPWAMPAPEVTRELQAEIAKKAAYLNATFFVIRAVAYFVIWTVLAWLLRRWSVRQDGEGGVRLTIRQRRLSAGGIPFLAVTLTFASFDWLMSLSPAWWSTVYGVYYFAGAIVAGISLVALLAMLAERAGILSSYVGDEHFGALGKLLLTFVIFWAYIAFAQLLIIWIGDIPAEVSWYIKRLHGGWGQVGLALLIFHFALPFLLLLPRDLKRNPRAMAAIGIMLLIMHYFDVYWLAMPELHPEGMSIHWLDFASLAAVIGCTTACGCWLFQRSAPVPLGDPYLDESVRYGREEVHE
ncbi:MAG TPA: hypothetical protein VFK04_01390 [Gemmatimonadaceae bacterium]|nr:hypothetical protein [Gemmatimonadaceae bacterium]